MLISDSHQFIFVHNRKAAGTSIRNRLAPFSLPPPQGMWNKLRSRAGLQSDYREHAFRLHAPISTAIDLMPCGLFAHYFKFAFVRNPWDRIVSEYEFVRNYDRHPRHRKVAAMNYLADFIHFQRKRGDAFQTKLLQDSAGDLAVDFIGRFERLAHDFEEVVRHIDVEVEPLAHLNPSRMRDYRDYYTTESIDLVARYWRDEIELFGYTFE
jgi:hypothetical protein